MAVYFNDIAMRFSLKWDTEYDEVIEDALWGSFPLRVDQVVEILQEMKKSAAGNSKPQG